MLSKMKKYIDVIIPRGGKSLVKKVQDFSQGAYHWTSGRSLSYIRR